MMRICLSLSSSLGVCLCEYAINFDNLPLLLKIDHHHHHFTVMLMMNMLRLLRLLLLLLLLMLLSFLLRHIKLRWIIYLTVWLPENQPHGKCNSVDKARERKKKNGKVLKNNFLRLKYVLER